jgi:hypothetical protein
VWFAAEFPQYTTLSGADGSFSVRSVQAGAQRVCVKPQRASGPSEGGYVRGCLPDKVEVTADSTTAGVHVEVAEAGAVSGTVSDADGNPLRYADVGVFRNGKFQRQALTKKDGSYSIKRLDPGNYVVCFLRSGFIPECYDDVPYRDYQTSPPPKAATPVAVLAGEWSEVDADLTPKR